MKSITDYIYESIEFDIVDSYYGKTGIVTLVRRENVDCENLSKEDFVKMMKEDLDIAGKEYKEICKKANDEYFEKRLEQIKKEAIEYAEKKYKRSSYKEKYIQNAIKNAEDSRKFWDKDGRIFFDFKPEKGEQGIRDVCILNPDKTDEKQLEMCFDEVSKSKYFKKATGWAFKYESREKDKVSVYSFRPYVDLLLDETSREEQKRDEERLANAIQDFYKGSNYWGD